MLRGMKRNCSWEQYFLRRIPWFKIHAHDFLYSKANTQYTSQTQPPKCPSCVTYHVVVVGLDFFLFPFLGQGLSMHQCRLQTPNPSALSSLQCLALYLDFFLIVAICCGRIFSLIFHFYCAKNNHAFSSVHWMIVIASLDKCSKMFKHARQFNYS